VSLTAPPFSLFFFDFVSTFRLSKLPMFILTITKQSLVGRRFRKAHGQDLDSWSGQTAGITALHTSVKSDKFAVLHSGSWFVQGKAAVHWIQLATNYLLKGTLRFVTLAVMVTLAFQRALIISMWIYCQLSKHDWQHSLRCRVFTVSLERRLLSVCVTPPHLTPPHPTPPHLTSPHLTTPQHNSHHTLVCYRFQWRLKLI